MEELNIFGLNLSQTRGALEMFTKILDEEKPQHIVEIGTAKGGLSAFLAIWAERNACSFATFELHYAPHPSNIKIIEALGGRMIFLDVFSHEGRTTIYEMLARPGKTVVLCDGGNKPEEFRTFGPHLKPGDLIMAHDYAKDSEAFHNRINGKIWCWHEISLDQVQETMDRNDIQLCHDEIASENVWLCTKRVK